MRRDSQTFVNFDGIANVSTVQNGFEIQDVLRDGLKRNERNKEGCENYWFHDLFVTLGKCIVVLTHMVYGEHQHLVNSYPANERMG